MFNPKRDRVTLGERRAGMIVIVVTGGLGYFMILFFHLVYFSFPTLSFSERSPLIYFILFPFFSSRFHSEHIYSFDEDIPKHRRALTTVQWRAATKKSTTKRSYTLGCDDDLLLVVNGKKPTSKG